MLPILPKIAPTTQARDSSHASSQPKKQIAKPVQKIKTSTPLFPKLIVIFGVLLILSQIIPLGWSYLSGYWLSSNNTVFSPVSAAFMEKLMSVTYVDPGANYFESIVAENKTTEINTEYKKTMRLTIQKAGINRTKVAANVPGNNAAIYDDALKHGVAHLKGTAVPGDPGISVIYGHSGIATFITGRSSPQIVFSRLDAVSIGDTMSIERDGKELRYVVSGKKIIEPQDLAFMSEQTEKERAILLTCWPLGIGTKRLIIIADRI